MAPALSPSSVVRNLREGVEHLVRGTTTSPGADPGDWLAVTVYRDGDAVRAGDLTRLTDLQPAVEYELRPAPADKGTEIHARVATAANAEVDADPAEVQRRLRVALRDTKALLETGSVMAVDPQPAGTRTNSPAGKAIDEAQASGREQGVL